MNESDLRNRLHALASTAVPAPRPLPTGVAKRARRGQLRSGLAIMGVLIALVAGGIYAVNSTRNLVGPAPVAGGEDQRVFDPPDHAFVSGYSLEAEVIDGAICAVFDVEVREFEEHRAAPRVCEPDPTAALSVGTQLVTFETDPPTELVVIGGGVAPNVARVEIVLSHRKFPVQEVPIVDSFKGPERRVAAEMLERNMMLDAKGRFRGTIRALDAEGKVLVEQALCDPARSAPSCEK